jgi:hypothetical protein
MKHHRYDIMPHHDPEQKSDMPVCIAELEVSESFPGASPSSLPVSKEDRCTRDCAASHPAAHNHLTSSCTSQLHQRLVIAACGSAKSFPFHSVSLPINDSDCDIQASQDISFAVTLLRTAQVRVSVDDVIPSGTSVCMQHNENQLRIPLHLHCWWSNFRGTLENVGNFTKL